MNPRDLELLSAYLDGQLNPSDSARLESRLASDESLRAVLNDLRANPRPAPSTPLPTRSSQLHLDSANGWHQTADAARRSGFPIRHRIGNILIHHYICGQWMDFFICPKLCLGSDSVSSWCGSVNCSTRICSSSSSTGTATPIKCDNRNFCAAFNVCFTDDN